MFSKYATIVAQNGYKYRLTNEDVLWAARMIYGETGNNYADVLAVLWSMTERMVHLGIGTRNPRIGRGESQRIGRTFKDLIQAYSQPINPYWLNRGPTHLQARRRRVQSRTMSQIQESHPDGFRALMKWAKGEAPSPFPGSGYVDFAAEGHIQGTLYDQVSFGTANRYGRRASTRRWPDGYVQIVMKDAWYQTPLGSAGIGVAIGLGALYAYTTWDR